MNEVQHHRQEESAAMGQAMLNALAEHFVAKDVGGEKPSEIESLIKRGVIFVNSRFHKNNS
jgi:hypothetical protein